MRFGGGDRHDRLPEIHLVLRLGLALILAALRSRERTLKFNPKLNLNASSTSLPQQCRPPVSRAHSLCSPLDRLSATRERPPVLAQPASTSSAACSDCKPPPPPAPPKVTLLGIVLDADEARAGISVETADKFAACAIGDIQGWKVTQIEERWVGPFAR